MTSSNTNVFTLAWYFVRALTARWRAIRDKSTVHPKSMGSRGRLQGVVVVVFCGGRRRFGSINEFDWWDEKSNSVRLVRLFICSIRRGTLRAGV